MERTTLDIEPSPNAHATSSQMPAFGGSKVLVLMSEQATIATAIETSNVAALLSEPSPASAVMRAE